MFLTHLREDWRNHVRKPLIKKKKVRDKGEERERQRGKEKKTKDRAPVYILFERGNEER